MTWIAGVSYANEIAPPGMGATAQALFSLLCLGWAMASGQLIGVAHPGVPGHRKGSGVHQLQQEGPCADQP